MNGYDELEPEEQIRERVRWDAGMERRIAALDLKSEFEATGTPYSELDAAGRVVTHHPGSAI